MTRIKEIGKNLIKDIKKVAPVLVGIGAYFIIMNAVFGMVCPFRMFFGIPCPTCGLTRSLVESVAREV